MVDDCLRRLEERAAPLLDRLDQPLGGVDLALDVVLRGRGRLGGGEHLPVQRADPQVGQVDVLEADLPAPVGRLVDVHVGLDRGHDRRDERRPRLGLEVVELPAQGLDLLDAEARLPLDEREPIGGEVLEVVGHEPAQLPPVGHVGADLEEQALAQVAAADARGIHRLHDAQRLLQQRQLAGGALGIDEFLQPHRQVAVGVEVVDDPVGRLAIRRLEVVVGELVVEVVGEGFGPLDHVGHDVEVAIAGLLDLGRRGAAAVVVGVRVFVRPVVGPFEVGLVGMVLVDDQRPFVDGPLGGRLRGVGDGHDRLGAPLLAGLLDLQRLVVLDLLLDPFLEGHDRELEDLHRLDHARRKHLLLRHPHFLAERHPHGSPAPCGDRSFPPPPDVRIPVFRRGCAPARFLLVPRCQGSPPPGRRLSPRWDISPRRWARALTCSGGGEISNARRSAASPAPLGAPRASPCRGKAAKAMDGFACGTHPRRGQRGQEGRGLAREPLAFPRKPKAAKAMDGFACGTHPRRGQRGQEGRGLAREPLAFPRKPKAAKAMDGFAAALFRTSAAPRSRRRACRGWPAPATRPRSGRGPAASAAPAGP